MHISRDEIHIWFADLRSLAHDLERMRPLLSPDEELRAARYAFDIHRNRFILRRGLLRTVLAHYVAGGPKNLVFTYGPAGKPALLIGPRFNLSDSEDYVILAVVTGCPIGVDIERIRPIPDAAEIATRFFSAAESAALSTVAPERHAEAFLACWTRKEAFLKATGGGLSTPLDSFQVELLPEREPRFLRIDTQLGHSSDWSLYDLRPATDAIAAVAVPGCGWHIRVIPYS
ncbi:4'-phosphopantetheinyl transferase [Candidatus Sulfopaludibacter sp. SbA3]|nr:4'-phosphopantetheinyl transferase [Candidatus Sulfopaludibacter sp. SbA3]